MANPGSVRHYAESASPNYFKPMGQYTDGLNVYEYVKSQPIVNSDAYGLLAEVCAQYTCMSCCKVGVTGYDKKAQQECAREARELESAYKSLIINYWENNTRFCGSYTRCDEYQSMVFDSNIASGMKYFKLYMGGERRGLGGYHNFVGVFHSCNRRKVFHHADRSTGEAVYAFPLGKVSDGTLDPWSKGGLPFLINHYYGSYEILPGRRSPMEWR